MNQLMPYPGNKAQQAIEICNYFPDHVTFVDVFTGGLGLLLNKRKSRIEIINDKNDCLVNLYNVIKYNLKEFKKQFDFYLNSKTFFDQIKYQDMDTMNKYEKAFRTMYLRYNSYLGVGRSFAAHPGPHLNFEKLMSKIKYTHERLKEVNIENRDYKKIIEKFDGPHTLFYLDPPYWGTENRGYMKGARSIDLAEFIATLENIKGRFILSHTEYAPFNKMWNSKIIGRRNNAGYINNSNKEKMKIKKYNELIYSNFKLVKENKLF